MLDLTGVREEVFKSNHAWDIWESDQRKQLNQYQQDAIVEAYYREFEMIQGPPGNIHDLVAMMSNSVFLHHFSLCMLCDLVYPLEHTTTTLIY